MSKRKIKKIALGSLLAIALIFMLTFICLAQDFGHKEASASMGLTSSIMLVGLATRARDKHPIERVPVVTSYALTNGNPIVIRDGWPLGKGYYTMNLKFKYVLTNTTGTTALALGELAFLKALQLKTDYDDMIFSLCGKEAYYRAWKQKKTAPYKDAISATAGTFYVEIPIHFANRYLRRPEDLILNTARYKNMELTIACGTVADFLGSVGDSAVTATVDITIEQTKKQCDKSNGPISVPYIYGMPPVDPVVGYIDIEKNPELALMNVWIFAGNSATAGIPVACTLADTTIASVQFEDSNGFPVRSIPWLDMKFFTKEQLEAETAPTGIVVIDFVRDKSIKSSYETGNLAKCQLNWLAGTLSTSQLTVLLDGWKAKKPKAGELALAA